MGQKVNPIGFRLGIIRTWSSRWYANNRRYSDLVQEDVQIRKYVHKKFSAAGISRIEIERAAKSVKVNIFTSRPGIIIGKKGVGAESLKEELLRHCDIKSSEPIVNVFEVKKPDLDAQLVADSVKVQIERRASFRRVMKKAIASTMKAGAKGIKVQCSGRLGGADMSRVERYHEGRVPLHTLRADIDYATSEAATTYGLIGVKVWICHGDVLDQARSQNT
ncbi:MAG: 30S ribosomal protein S3 [Oligoflexales bacterium]|nr:30S ribosomal protein S3 [Oligoflexales bacterium]